eukprot:c18557_g1_i1.p2 GENE.c18557_g1_i1~~c18557_g1_i1.p2  ORF type:complete len:214 (-),score=97.94 c18557_g1_i1:32-673(-)
MNPKQSTLNLPNIQRKDFEDAFAIFDKNADGSISLIDLEKSLTGMGYKPTPEQVVKLLKEVDKNDSGEIEFDEFCAVLLENLKDPEYELKEAFHSLDLDKDGLLSKEELWEGLKRIGVYAPESDVDEMIAKGDSDGDGKISYEDFRKMNLGDGNENDINEQSLHKEEEEEEGEFEDQSEGGFEDGSKSHSHSHDEDEGLKSVGGRIVNHSETK